MAKDRERRTAKILYVDQNLTAKETSERVGVTEKTVGDWVEKGNWKALRDAKNASPAKRINNIKQIISNLSDEWLELDRQVKKLEGEGGDLKEIAETRSRIKGIDDAVSKWNKTLENIEKDSNVSLSTYLHVMEDIFDSLAHYNRELYLSLIDFQEYHINKVSTKH